MTLSRIASAAAMILCGIAVAAAAVDDDFSPWDAWRDGYMYFDRGEQARDRRDYERALHNFRESLRCYRSVKQARPDWNQELIDARISQCEQEITAVAGLSGRRPEPASGSEKNADKPSGGSHADTPDGSAASSARMKSDLDEYRRKLHDATTELEKIRQTLAQRTVAAADVENMMRERRVLQEKCQILELRCQDLQKKLSAPDSAAETARRQILELRINLETAERKLKLAAEQKTSLERDMAELHRFRRQQEQELQKARSLAAANDEELASLRRARETAAEEKNQFLSRESGLKSSLAEAEKQLNVRRREVETLQKRLLEATDSRRADALNKEIAEENRRLRSGAEKARTDLQKALQSGSQLQEQLQKNRLALADVQEALQRVDDRRKQAESENKMLRSRLDKDLASQNLNNVELQKLRNRNQRLEEDLKLWINKLDQTERKLNRLDRSGDARIAGLNAERDKLNAELVRSREEIARLRGQLDATSKALTTERQSAAAAAAKESVRTAESAQAAASVRNMAAERDRIASELADVKHELASAKTEAREVRRLRQRVQELHAALAGLRAEGDGEEAVAAEVPPLPAPGYDDSNQPAAPVDGLDGTGSGDYSEPKLPPVVFPSGYDELLRDARKAASEGRLKAALWHYRTIVENNPNHHEANLECGELLMRMGLYSEAEQPLHRAYKDDESDASARLTYARCLLDLRKYNEALPLLETLAGRGGNDGQLQLALGQAYAGSRRYRDAERSFRLASSALPDRFEPPLSLARLIVNQPDRGDEAAQCYRLAKKLGAPPDAMLEKRLAKSLDEREDVIDFMISAAEDAEKHGDLDSAIWYYTQLRDISPQPNVYTKRLACCLLLLRRYDEALETLNNRDDAESFIIRSFIYWRQSRFSEMRTSVSEALRINRGLKCQVPPTLRPLLPDLRNAPPEAASAAAALLDAVGQQKN